MVPRHILSWRAQGATRGYVFKRLTGSSRSHAFQLLLCFLKAFYAKSWPSQISGVRLELAYGDANRKGYSLQLWVPQVDAQDLICLTKTLLARISEQWRSADSSWTL